MARASRSGPRSASGQDSSSAAAIAGSATSGASGAIASTRTTAGGSASGSGEQVRQRPSAAFQQLPHVYWRHVMQKLKVLWKASSWWVVALRSTSLRASAIASEKLLSSCMT